MITGHKLFAYKRKNNKFKITHCNIMFKCLLKFINFGINKEPNWFTFDKIKFI